MRKIYILVGLLFIAFGLSAQGIRDYQPGRTIMQSAFTLSATAGTDTSFKFRFPEGAEIYTIQINGVDTINPSDTVFARLYGSMDGANWTAIGDTIQIDSVNYPCTDYWTGTNFPWPFGKVEVDAVARDTSGIINLIIWYKE